MNETEIAFRSIPDGQPLPPECYSKSGKVYAFTRSIRDKEGKVISVTHPKPNEVCGVERGTARIADIAEAKEAGLAATIEDAEAAQKPSQPPNIDLRKRYFMGCLRYQRGRFEEYTNEQLMDIMGLLQLKNKDVPLFEDWLKAIENG